MNSRYSKQQCASTTPANAGVTYNVFDIAFNTGTLLNNRVETAVVVFDEIFRKKQNISVPDSFSIKMFVGEILNTASYKMEIKLSILCNAKAQ